MENGWVDSLWQDACVLFVDDHVFSVDHSLSASHQQFVSGGQHRHGRDQPAVSNVSLHAVIWGQIVAYKLGFVVLGVFGRADDFIVKHPLDLFRFNITLWRISSHLVQALFSKLVFRGRSEVRINPLLEFSHLALSVNLRDSCKCCFLAVKNSRFVLDIVVGSDLVILVRQVQFGFQLTLQVVFKQWFIPIDVVSLAEFVELVEFNESHSKCIQSVFDCFDFEVL